MLEVRIILHPASGGPSREIGNMHIIQVAQSADNLRDYSVRAWYQPLKRREPEREYAAVHDHDRTGSPWDLVRKAIAGLR